MKEAFKAIRLWIKNNPYVVMSMVAIGILATAEQRFFYDVHPHWQIFLKEIAFAGLIASVFGLTIERYQREEFVKLVNKEREDLKRDIFLYAYGHTVPEQIREEIKERILKTPFHREDLRIEWEFDAVTDKPGYVKLQKRISYVQKNNTPQVQEVPFKFTQITASEKDAMVSTVFDVLKMQDKDGLKTVKASDMKNEPTGEPLVRTLVHAYKIGPFDSAEVFYALTEQRRLHADDMYSPSLPVVGTTTVTVRVNEPLDLELSAACKGRVLATRPEHNPPRRYCWELREGLLPFQGIALSWAPSSKSVPERNEHLA